MLNYKPGYNKFEMPGIIQSIFSDNGGIKSEINNYCGDHFIMYKNVKSLCNIPEPHITLYVDYNSVTPHPNYFHSFRFVKSIVKREC